MAKCKSCKNNFIGYGDLCDICAKSNLEKKTVVHYLNLQEQEIYHRVCEWYNNNYKEYKTGKYKEYYFGDISRILDKITSHISVKYEDYLHDYKLFGDINRFGRLLFYAAKDNLIPDRFEEELNKCSKIDKTPRNRNIKQITYDRGGEMKVHELTKS
jgi:hypothetical protein